MADKVSPGRTVHLAARSAGPAVTRAFSVVTDSLVGTTCVLLAMPMFAWAAGWSGPRAPTAATRASRHQASTTHADMVHLRTMVLASFLGDQRRDTGGPAPEGMGLVEGSELSRRDLRQERAPDRTGVSAPLQP